MASALRARGLHYLSNGLAWSAKPGRNVVVSSRSMSLSETLFPHVKYHNKLEIPTVDKEGKPIPRSPNGKVTTFELWREGVLKKPENKLIHLWNTEQTYSGWGWRWLLGFGMGCWGFIYTAEHSEHLVFGSSLYRAEIRKELRAEEEAAAAAGTSV